MVVILCDQFAQLADGVVFTERQMLADVRNLGPDNKSCLVAKIVEILCMLIVGEPYGIRAALQNQPDVFFMHFPGQRVTVPSAVLMPADAMQRIIPSV